MLPSNAETPTQNVTQQECVHLHGQHTRIKQYPRHTHTHSLSLSHTHTYIHTAIITGKCNSNTLGIQQRLRLQQGSHGSDYSMVPMGYGINTLGIQQRLRLQQGSHGSDYSMVPMGYGINTLGIQQRLRLQQGSHGRVS